MGFIRTRQAVWDKRHLVTVSTHLTAPEFETLKIACACRGTKPYALIRDYLRQYSESVVTQVEQELGHAGGTLPPPREIAKDCVPLFYLR